MQVSFFFFFPIFEGPKTKIGIRSDGYFFIFQICILCYQKNKIDPQA